MFSRSTSGKNGGYSRQSIDSSALPSSFSLPQLSLTRPHSKLLLPTMTDAAQASNAIQQSPQHQSAASSSNSATLPSIRSFRTRFLFGKGTPSSKKQNHASQSQSVKVSTDTPRKSIGDVFPVDVGNQSLDHHLGRAQPSNSTHSSDTLPRMHSQPILRPLSAMKRKSWDFGGGRAVSSPIPRLPSIDSRSEEKIIDVRSSTPPTLATIDASFSPTSSSIPVPSHQPSASSSQFDLPRPSIDSVTSVNTANGTRVVDLSSGNITLDRGRLGDLARELGQAIADKTTVSLLQALENGNLSLTSEDGTSVPGSETASPVARQQIQLQQIKSSVDRMEAMVADRDSKIFIGQNAFPQDSPSPQDLSFQSAKIDVDLLEDHLNRRLGDDFAEKMIEGDSASSPLEATSFTAAESPIDDERRERVSVDLGALDPDLAALLSPHNLLEATPENTGASPSDNPLRSSTTSTVGPLPLSSAMKGFTASTPAKTKRRASLQAGWPTPVPPLPRMDLDGQSSPSPSPVTPISRRSGERSRSPTPTPTPTSTGSGSSKATGSNSKRPPPPPALFVHTSPGAASSTASLPPPSLTVDSPFGHHHPLLSPSPMLSSKRLRPLSPKTSPGSALGTLPLPRSSPRDPTQNLPRASPRDPTFNLPRSSPRDAMATLALSPRSSPRDVTGTPLPSRPSSMKRRVQVADKSAETVKGEREDDGGDWSVTPQPRRARSPQPPTLALLSDNNAKAAAKKLEKDLDLDSWRREVVIVAPPDGSDTQALLPDATSTPNLNSEDAQAQFLTVHTPRINDISPSASSGSGTSSSPVTPQATHTARRRRPRASTSASDLVQITGVENAASPGPSRDPYSRPRTAAADYGYLTPHRGPTAENGESEDQSTARKLGVKHMLYPPRPNTSAAHYTTPTPASSASRQSLDQQRPRFSLDTDPYARPSTSATMRVERLGRRALSPETNTILPFDLNHPNTAARPPLGRSFTALGSYTPASASTSSSYANVLATPSRTSLDPGGRYRGRRSYSIDEGPAGDLAVAPTDAVSDGRVSLDSVGSTVTRTASSSRPSLDLGSGRPSLDINTNRAQAASRLMAADSIGPLTRKAFAAAGLVHTGSSNLDEGEDGLRSRSGSVSTASGSKSGWRSASGFPRSATTPDFASASSSHHRFLSQHHLQSEDWTTLPPPSPGPSTSRTLYSAGSTISHHTNSSGTVLTSATSAASLGRLQQQDEMVRSLREEQEEDLRILKEQHEEGVRSLQDQHEAEIDALRERHDLEKEALLMSLSESKRVHRQVVKEKEDLMQLVKELEQRLAAAMNLNTRLAASGSAASVPATPTPAAGSGHRYAAGRKMGGGGATTPRAAPAPTPDRTRLHPQQLWNLQPTGMTSSSGSSRNSPSSSRHTARPFDNSTAEPGDISIMVEDHDADEEQNFVESATSSPPASLSRRSRNRRSTSESSVILPTMTPSRSMSLLLNEPPPSHHYYGTSSSSASVSPASPNLILPHPLRESVSESDNDHDDNRREPHGLGVEAHMTMATSPHSTSYSYDEHDSALPSSPGSLRLKLADEIHLNDLVSFTLSDGEYDMHDDGDGDDEDTDWTTPRRRVF